MGGPPGLGPGGPTGGPCMPGGGALGVTVGVSTVAVGALGTVAEVEVSVGHL